MKPFTFIIVILLGVTTFAQNLVIETIKNSDLQLIAEQLGLEPGSEHTIQNSFTIEKSRNLTHIKASSEYPELQAEGLKIVRTIKN